MSSQTNSQDTPRQKDDSNTAKSAKETKLDRLANEAAWRAVKRQLRYDQGHNIFIK